MIINVYSDQYPCYMHAAQYIPEDMRYYAETMATELAAANVGHEV